jgi:heme-degrading monooxygenase HmoA
VIAGECGIAEVSPRWRAGQGQPPYVAVREFDDLGRVEETREVARRHALPVVTGSPGFRAVYVFKDERERSRGALVALFDTREDARRSHERSLQVLREEAGGVAPTPPWAATGRAIVFAAAD